MCVVFTMSFKNTLYVFCSYLALGSNICFSSTNIHDKDMNHYEELCSRANRIMASYSDGNLQTLREAFDILNPLFYSRLKVVYNEYANSIRQIIAFAVRNKNTLYNTCLDWNTVNDNIPYLSNDIWGRIHEIVWIGKNTKFLYTTSYYTNFIRRYAENHE